MQQARRSMKWLKTKREYVYEHPESSWKVLDIFPNPGVSYVVMDCVEFTSLCPITGQPDYGRVIITYIPDRHCLESKSLKLYLGMYRQYGGFAEQITEKICEDLNKVLNPKEVTVHTKFTTRGGVSIEAYSSRRLQDKRI